MAASSLHTGWHFDRANTRVDVYYQGTRAGHFNSTGQALTGTLDANGNIASTTGNITATAGDLRITAGNVRLGAVNAFGTTEPTQGIVIESGTAPAGAVTTSSGVFASDTVLRKIIADGTVSNVG